MDTGKQFKDICITSEKGNDMKAEKKVRDVQDLITEWAGIDGSHHKQWLIDEIIRVITGDGYDQWVSAYNNGEDGPNTYEWDKGIAP